MEKVSQPVRILALVLVLVGLGGMLALRMMGPSADPLAIPAPAKQAAEPAQPAKAAASIPAVKAPKPAKPKLRLNPVIPPTGFPLAVDKVLRRYEVVVVSLVLPGARVDALAAAEAEAGAKLGGVGYLALNVLNESVARALLTKLTVAVTDPSVLVLKRSGELVVALSGFVDRETVAQAAANASS